VRGQIEDIDRPIGSKDRTRDIEMVRIVGRHGAVTVEQVMRAMGTGRTATYRRVAACIDGGLVERLSVLRSEPSLLRAKRAGLRYAGLGLPVAAISPGTVEHLLRCTSTALAFGEIYGHDRILTERELLLAEQIEGRAIARAEVGGSGRGRSRHHRADLAILTDSGTIAIEVELTPKSPRRLEHLIRAWRRAIAMRVVAEVRYLCAPGQTRRAVERAVRNVKAEEVIAISEVEPR
jgi:hypothetical protein